MEPNTNTNVNFWGTDVKMLRGIMVVVIGGVFIL